MMARTTGLRFGAYWNTARMMPGTAEGLLRNNGIRVVEHGMQPDRSRGERGRRIVVQTTKKKVEAFLQKYPGLLGFRRTKKSS